MSTFNKFLLAFIVYILFTQFGFSQCAMCRAVLETEEGGIKAGAVNDGIVYLMIFPYLLVGVGGYFAYKIFKKKQQEKTN